MAHYAALCTGCEWSTPDSKPRSNNGEKREDPHNCAPAGAVGALPGDQCRMVVPILAWSRSRVRTRGGRPGHGSRAYWDWASETARAEGSLVGPTIESSVDMEFFVKKTSVSHCLSDPGALS